MRKEQIADRFREVIGDAQVICDEPLSAHTTFRIGGPADWFLMPRAEEEILELLRICRREEIPWFVLGNGSNLLVSDEGFRGAVILIDRNWQAIDVEGTLIRAQAGAKLTAVVSAAKDAGAGGLEFASGIPGSVGGAVAMNAGAYGGEMRDVLERVRLIKDDLSICTLPAEELALGYRTSLVKEKMWIVLSAEFRLTEGRREEIESVMEELRKKRIAKQPLNYPSAGSTFKRPPGQFAGKLIMETGLAGFSVGDAAVSEKHCGFVINRGNATAADVYRLICKVQERVRERTGVELEPEIRMLGDFSYVG